MKKVIISVAVAILVTSCNNGTKPTAAQSEAMGGTQKEEEMDVTQKPEPVIYIPTEASYALYVQIVDSCEYIVATRYRGGTSIIHKANCKNH